MTDTTQLILSKYYGFSADSKNKKFLSSHDGTYDPVNYHPSSRSYDLSTTETTKFSDHRATDLEMAKVEIGDFNAEDSDDNAIVRSSRAIPEDDTLDDDDNDVNTNETSMESSNRPKDGRFSAENKITEEKYLTDKLEKNYEQHAGIHEDSNPNNVDDVISENISEISSITTRKELKRKNLLTTTLTTTSSRPATVSKKIPACNGIFFDLTDLRLVEFPVTLLADIPNLRMLYLENNSLTILPNELFTSLKLLHWLDVRNNRLSSLPKSIEHHTRLETILLEGNQFERLPLELGSLPNLKHLQTSRNPLIFPTADVLALGFGATINCLRSEWNKLNPDEAIESPDPSGKPKSLTVLCSDPPVLRKYFNSSRHKFGSSSTGHVDKSARKISVRERSKNYKPSNKYNTNCYNYNYSYKNNDELFRSCDCWLKSSTEPARSRQGITTEDDVSAIVKSHKIKLPKIKHKPCTSHSNIEIQARDRVFYIVTNDRTFETFCPMRVNDPDRMMAFLENYLGIKKSTMGWFPPR